MDENESMVEAYVKNRASYIQGQGESFEESGIGMLAVYSFVATVIVCIIF
jgi:hypothetical protein